MTNFAFAIFFLLPFLICGVQCQKNPCNRQKDHFIDQLCYTIVNEKKTFDDAQSFCHFSNPSGPSQLAVFKTTTQNNFITSIVSTETRVLNTDVFWIGLSRSTFNSRFKWDDGTQAFWTRFAPGFPGSANYVAVQVKNGLWQTIDSNFLNVFVCSYDPFNQGETSSTLLTTPELASTTGQPWWFTTEQPWWPTTEETPGTTTGETPGTTTGETPGTTTGETPGATTGETPGTTTGETPGTTTGETPGATTGETPGTTTGETPGATTTYDYSTTEEPSTTDDYYSSSSEPPVTSEEPWWWQPTTDDYYYSSSDWLDKSKAVNSYRQMKKKLIK